MFINQAYENMGLANTQTIATLFDGMARHSPEGSGLKDAQRKWALNRLLQIVTRKIRYQAVKNELKAFENLTQECT